MRRASRSISNGMTCSVRYAATESSRPFSVASPRPWMPSSVTSFSVTKLRPGLQTMTLPSTMRMLVGTGGSGLVARGSLLVARRARTAREQRDRGRAGDGDHDERREAGVVARRAIAQVADEHRRRRFGDAVEREHDA